MLKQKHKKKAKNLVDNTIEKLSGYSEKDLKKKKISSEAVLERLKTTNVLTSATALLFSLVVVVLNKSLVEDWQVELVVYIFGALALFISTMVLLIAFKIERITIFVKTIELLIEDIKVAENKEKELLEKIEFEKQEKENERQKLITTRKKTLKRKYLR